MYTYIDIYIYYIYIYIYMYVCVYTVYVNVRTCVCVCVSNIYIFAAPAGRECATTRRSSNIYIYALNILILCVSIVFADHRFHKFSQTIGGKSRRPVSRDVGVNSFRRMRLLWMSMSCARFGCHEFSQKVLVHHVSFFHIQRFWTSVFQSIPFRVSSYVKPV